MYFEEFDSFGIDKRELFLKHSQEEWIAESSFTSIFMWQSVLKTHYHVFNGIFCCFFEKYNEPPFAAMYCPSSISIEAIEKTLKQLMKLFAQKCLLFKLGYVTKSLSEKLDRISWLNYKVHYDIGYSDYIYDTREFMSFEGPFNRKKRYEWNHFVKHQMTEIEMITVENSYNCIEFIKKVCCSQNKCGDCGYGCERKALEAVLGHFSALKCEGIIVSIEGETVAYAIGEKLSQRMYAYHFLRLQKNYIGLGYFLQTAFGNQFHSKIPYINYGEDLNDDGLRNYKKKRRPFLLAHKYEFQF